MVSGRDVSPAPSLYSRLKSFYHDHEHKILVTAILAGAATILGGVGLILNTPHKSHKNRTPLLEALEGQTNAELVECTLGDHDPNK